MDFSWTKEQKLIRKTAREFSQKEILPRLKEIDEGRKIPNEIIEGMAKMGFLGMTVSPEYGGIDADPMVAGIVAEEIARADIGCAVPTFFLVEAAWGHILNKYGSREVKEAILPKVTKGKAFLGIAATEPSVGSDLANMETVAKKIGDNYIINGEKAYISGIKEAMDQLPDGGGHLTLAKTDIAKGTRGMSLFYVPLNKKGITPTIFEDWGRRGISSGGFVLEKVEIPESYLVGEENRGFHISMEGFDYARAIISVVCCGATMSALERAIDYIKQRSAFGQPIGRFEGIQLKLAEHWAKLDAIRLLSYKALWTYGKEQKEKSFGRFETTKKCAEAKLLAPLFAFEAINDAIQWFGAFGYTMECPLNLALKGVRSYYWAEGTREIMGIIIARELLGKEYVAYR